MNAPVKMGFRAEETYTRKTGGSGDGGSGGGTTNIYNIGNDAIKGLNGGDKGKCGCKGKQGSPEGGGGPQANKGKEGGGGQEETLKRVFEFGVQVGEAKAKGGDKKAGQLV